MDELELELKICFLDESTQNFDLCEKCFLNLEHDRENPQLIHEIFRLAHNLKGGAQTAGFEQIVEFAHEFENLLLKIKKKTISVSDSTISLLLECNDHLRMIIGILRTDLNAKIDHGDLLTRIKNFSDSLPTTQVALSSPPKDHVMSPPKHLSPDESTPPHASTVPIAPHPSLPEETIRVALSRLEKLNNFVGELVVYQAVLSQHLSEIKSPFLQKTILQLNKVTREVQQISMSCRMVPLKSTFQKLQRTARDTSLLLGKHIDLEMMGEETEVDKTVIEYLDDILIHIVRNSVDHGIEEREERAKSQKPENGKLHVKAHHQGDRLVIEIQDDGRGLNKEKIFLKALEEGLVPKGCELLPHEIHQLIFLPGFTTKTQASEISGRGVGLDVVKNSIERLSGDIQIESEEGKGTLFRIFFPLTLAIMESLVVFANDERYIIPLNQVHETILPEQKLMSYVTGKGDVLNLRGETVPLFYLRELLNLPSDNTVKDPVALIVRGQRSTFGIVVDRVLRQQQVVMKQLGPEIRDRHGLLGSAILGDGLPAIVLDMQDLVRSKINPPRPPKDLILERVVS